MSSTRLHSDTNPNPRKTNIFHKRRMQVNLIKSLNDGWLRTSATSKSLNLRRKTRLLLGTAIASLVGVLYAASSFVLIDNTERTEAQATHQVVQGVFDAFTQTQIDFDARYADWAAWDDSYTFIENGNSQYIQSNLTGEQLTLGNLNLAIYINSKNKIVYGTGFDRNNNKVLPLPQSIRQYISDSDRLLQHPNIDSFIAGLILLPEGLMMISSRPILTSNSTGPSRGTVIFGRYVDSQEIQILSKKTRVSLRLYPFNNQQLPQEVQTARAAVSSTNQIWIQPANNQLITGYILLKDIDNHPVGLLRVDLPRESYQQSHKSLRYLFGLLVLIGLIIGSITLPLLERLIIFRFEREEREERYHAVVAQASEGIYLIDSQTKKFLEANAAMHNLLGYTATEILQLTLYDVVLGDRDRLNADLQQVSAGKRNFTREYKYCCRDGSIIDIEASAIEISYDEKATFCIVVRDITKRKKVETALRESEKRLSWQASHDPLTELFNRREFEQRLTSVFKDVKIENQQHVLCYIDLDQFKIINDTCGHVAGDQLLRQVSVLFQNKIRKTDTLARLGGDEFGLILHQCPLEKATKIAESLCKQVDQFPFVWKEKVFHVSASIGVVAIDADTPNLVNVFSAADAACYVAKNKGRNRVHVYQLDDRELAQQQGEMQWVARIPKALEENRFCLYYQVIAPLAANSTQKHYEILLRLKDENGQIVSPMAFIPAAERYNLMHLIDRWVISTLFAYLAQRQPTNLEDISIYAVNISGASINDESFITFVQAQLNEYQIFPPTICFEITETQAITNLSKAAEFIRELKALGCRFALDDFGSGMSSFAYLKNLPVDYLKIDGSFIKDIVQDAIAYEMVEAISRIASVMQLQTIAEFVENDAIIDKLKLLAVDYAQGYGIGKPIPLE